MPQTTETPAPRDGEVRAVDAREYGYADGWLVEQYGFWAGRDMWAIPAWDEAGHAGLAGPFATRAEAEAAIAAEQE